MSLVNDILGRPDLVDAPPVLVDIGASGPLHPKWKAIAPYSTCVAFEGHEAVAPGTHSGFRELHARAAIVAERAHRRLGATVRLPVTKRSTPP